MADWLGINSSHLDSHCGNSGVRKLDEALDGTDSWDHDVDETHWFILDLGVSYNITKVRGRSDDTDDPIDVNVYVSNDKENWGVAVASGINTWQDTANWVEVDTTDKEGRYVKVEIVDTEDLRRDLGFGDTSPTFSIFDVYGSLANVDVPVSTLALQLTLQTPLAFENKLILPSTLALRLSLPIPTYFSGALITPAALVLELSLQVPSVLLNFDAAITPATFALQLSLKDPAVGIVFHSLVTPSVLALQLTLPVPVYGGVLLLVAVDARGLEITLRQPIVGSMFPTLLTSPSLEQYVDEFDEETILRDSYSSGYPLLNPQFDFDPKHFQHILRNVSQADKILLMNFYEGNSENEVFWLNEQDGNTYVVIFLSKPLCELDASKNEHRIELNLKQAVELET